MVEEAEEAAKLDENGDEESAGKNPGEHGRQKFHPKIFELDVGNCSIDLCCICF